MARVVLVETDSVEKQIETRVSLDFENLIKHIHGKQIESLSNLQET